MKLYEMTIEQYNKWCESPQGLAFNDELTVYLDDKLQSPKDMYEALSYIKSMFEREVNLDGRVD